ncbi:MAG: Calx-beta domain-containing protein, partial [Planctomycetales bacterium]
MFARAFWSRWCRQLWKSSPRFRQSAVRRRPLAGRGATTAPTAEVLETRTLLSTITVTSLADNQTADGLVTLREALRAANTNASVDGSTAGQAGVQDVIVFQAGLVGTISLSQGQLEISETVRIQGLGPTNTVIDAKAHSRIFNITSTAGNVALDSLTITGGKTSSNYDRGGAISLRSNARLTINNSTITGNATLGTGSYGGAIYASGSGSLTVTNSSITNNSTKGGAATGGAISMSSGSIIMSNTLVSGNSTAGLQAYGGALSMGSGSLTMTNSTFYLNKTTGPIGYGGAMRLVSGNLTMTNSTIVGNRTTGVYAEGGGINLSFGSLDIANSIIANNIMEFVDPTGNFGGNDLKWSDYNERATAKIVNTILGRNDNVPVLPPILPETPGGIPDSNGNIVGTVARPRDPMLGPLADNGGITMTLAPLAGSPVIDRGSNARAVDPISLVPLANDQRGPGFARIVGARVDMGAHELQATRVTLSVDPTSMPEASGSVTITATLSALLASDATITLAFSGTAIAGTDYYASATQIVIPAGSLTGTATLTASQDPLFEGNETAIVDIASVTNAVEDGVQQVTVTIVDDDAAPTVTLGINPIQVAETGGQSTVTATLSAISGLDTTVLLAFSGTAVLDTDYSMSATQIVIPAGSLSQTATLSAKSDSSDEPNESAVIDIASVTNGTENGVQQVTATIIDDDEPSITVTLSRNPATLAEAAGQSTVTATLSAVSGLETTVFLIFSGSAQAGTDYSASATQIVIPAGNLTGTVTLTASQDALFEGN